MSLQSLNLRQTGKIVFSAGEKFEPREMFVINTVNAERLLISDMGEMFQKEFFDKNEEVRGSAVFCYTIAKNMTDSEVISEFGGEQKAEISLYGFYQTLVHCQLRGKVGAFRVFYIRNIHGKLRTVLASWHDHPRGWKFYVRSTDFPSKWGSGCAVHSFF